MNKTKLIRIKLKNLKIILKKFKRIHGENDADYLERVFTGRIL